MPRLSINPRRMRLPHAGAGAAVILALVVAGCGSEPSGGAGGGRTAPPTGAGKLTDAGCAPHRLDLTAGPTTFEVSNDDAEKVSEFEILGDNGVLGEVEHVAPGRDGSFSL